MSRTAWMRDGERQVAESLADIRRDHVARYEWAAAVLIKAGARRVIDYACGVGYGAHILASAGLKVMAYDYSLDALMFALKRWRHRDIEYFLSDARYLAYPAGLASADAAVCFETIEHLPNPSRLLRALRDVCPLLLASVPNEDVLPYQTIRPDGVVVRTMHHHRHYTREQFYALLSEWQWLPEQWLGQAGPESDVEPDVNGRTIIAACS